MQADLPHTLYYSDRKKGRRRNGNENYTYNSNDPAIKKQMEAIRRKKERLVAEGKMVDYTMDELFNR
jgi:hypothetical protein